MCFTKDNRVRLRKDFESIKAEGKKIDCSAFILYVKPSEGEKSKLGIIASKKVGNAVQRNHAKRVFRAIFRESYASMEKPIEILVFVRSAYQKFSYAQLKEHFQKGLQRQ